MNKPASAKTNLILDLIIFGAFLVVYDFRLTGTSLHEWLGIAFAATIILHMLFHWQWMVTITTEFFKKLIHESRLNYIVDAIFYIALTCVTFSGILIARDFLQVFGIQLTAGPGWRAIHNLTASLTLISLGVHIGLHWNWVVTTFNRHILSPIRSLGHSHPKPVVDNRQPDSGNTVIYQNGKSI
jgi:hypothetical protein